MKIVLALLCFTAAFMGTACGQKSTAVLDQEDVWLLVMNIPAVMEVEARKGCPNLEFHPEGKNRMYVLVRNQCPVSGNGTMGNYTVDLRDGRVWFDMEETKIIDSELLQRLRKVLLSRQRLRAQSESDHRSGR